MGEVHMAAEEYDEAVYRYKKASELGECSLSLAVAKTVFVELEYNYCFW